MAALYHTDALVVSRTNIGEWDARVGLFTRDLGLIFVVVKAYRRPTSKLRPHLTLFGYVRASVVRGREVWRLTGVENMGFSGLQIHTGECRKAVGQVVNILRRLIRGEEAHPELFDDVREGIVRLSAVGGADAVMCKRLELVTVFRVLYHLGYIPELPELMPYTGEYRWDKTDWLAVDVVIPSMVQTINTSLQATHL